MKKLVALVAACFAFVATPAHADTPAPVNLGGCEDDIVTLVEPDAIDCSGYWDGNLNGGSETLINAQITALAEIGYTFDGDWSAVEGTTVLSLENGNQINFGVTMYGLTYIGVHFGNVPNPEYGNVTVFWVFDFGTEGADYITLSDTQGFSNAVLFATGVPEPSTWMMLLLGFFAVGFTLRNGKAKRFGKQGLATA